MSEEIQEYNDAKALRLKYPVVLTDKQMQEIIALLPISPVREDLVSLGLSHGYDFTTQEIIMYWMYQDKIVKGLSLDHVDQLKKETDLIKRKYLAKAHGGLMYIYVSNVLKNDGAKNDIDFEKKKELSKKTFDTWKNGTPKGMFKLQLVGYQNMININLKIFGKTESNGFLQSLIK